MLGPRSRSASSASVEFDSTNLARFFFSLSQERSKRQKVNRRVLRFIKMIRSVLAEGGLGGKSAQARTNEWYLFHSGVVAFIKQREKFLAGFGSHFRSIVVKTGQFTKPEKVQTFKHSFVYNIITINIFFFVYNKKLFVI